MTSNVEPQSRFVTLIVTLLFLSAACTALVLPAVVDVGAPAGPTEEALTIEPDDSVEAKIPEDPAVIVLEDALVGAPEDVITP